MATRPPRDALVLSAGGARAAYQVGVLRGLARLVPEYQPTIFCGVSAGSINACALAQGEGYAAGIERLYEQWSNLTSEQVLKANFRSLAGAFFRLAMDMTFSRASKKRLLHSLLDARPLAATLLKNMRFGNVARAVRDGRCHGIAVISTDLHNSTTCAFYDSHDDVQPWKREGRRGLRGPIHVKHVIASCAIPILFEPMRIGGRFYGDGAIRFCFPLSPVVRMGADRIFAVATQRHEEVEPAADDNASVGMGFVAGAVLNCLFQDSLEGDMELLDQINQARPERAIRTMRIRPSIDLGKLANAHLHEMPFHLRQLLRSSADRSELGALVSYLLFSPGYLRELLAVGERDAEAKADDFRAFLALPTRA